MGAGGGGFSEEGMSCVSRVLASTLRDEGEPGQCSATATGVSECICDAAVALSNAGAGAAGLASVPATADFDSTVAAAVGSLSPAGAKIAATDANRSSGFDCCIAGEAEAGAVVPLWPACTGDASCSGGADGGCGRRLSLLKAWSACMSRATSSGTAIGGTSDSLRGGDTITPRWL